MLSSNDIAARIDEVGRKGGYRCREDRAVVEIGTCGKDLRSRMAKSKSRRWNSYGQCLNVMDDRHRCGRQRHWRESRDVEPKDPRRKEW